MIKRISKYFQNQLQWEIFLRDHDEKVSVNYFDVHFFGFFFSGCRESS